MVTNIYNIYIPISSRFIYSKIDHIINLFAISSSNVCDRLLCLILRRLKNLSQSKIVNTLPWRMKPLLSW